MMSLVLALLLGASSLAELPDVPAGSLRFYVVRHGQAYSNLSPAPADMKPGELDQLTPQGREQARRSGEVLKDKAIALIVCSPRKRTRQSAEEIRAALGRDVEIRVDERLRPLEMGRGSGGRELEWNDRWEQWEFGQDPAPPSGESLEELGQRVLSVMLELKRSVSGRAVVLVTHSEVVSNTVGFLRGETLTGRFGVRINNASLTAVESGPATLPQVLLVNWLPEAPAQASRSSHAGAAGSSPRRRAAP
ncbi:MAG: histidine phosphatase family protein [Vicinamibacteria bacterium]